MADELLFVLTVVVDVLGISWFVTKIMRAIVVTIRAWALRRRNRRWVRNRPRPACPDVAGRGRAQTAAGVATRTVVTSAVPDSERRRVHL